jgi:preprotein translocase subunit YajC
LTAKLPKAQPRSVTGQFDSVKVGDRIMVTGSKSGRNGQTGKVIKVYDNGTVNANMGDGEARSYRATSYRVL